MKLISLSSIILGEIIRLLENQRFPARFAANSSFRCWYCFRKIATLDDDDDRYCLICKCCSISCATSLQIYHFCSILTWITFLALICSCLNVAFFSCRLHTTPISSLDDAFLPNFPISLCKSSTPKSEMAYLL